MSSIIKGDEYSLPITITKGSTTITPSNVDDVRILVGDVLKEYSKSEITFDSTNNQWLYPLTQSETLKLNSILVAVQVGIKVSGTIKYASMQKINLMDNIIKKEW